LSRIDREKYPDQVQEIETYLEEKLSDPSYVVQSNIESGFFNSHIPSEIVTSIWLRLLGWTIFASIVIAFPIILIVSLILSSYGYDSNAISSLSTILNILIYLVFSWLFLRKVLGGKLNNYELMFVKKKINKERN